MPFKLVLLVAALVSALAAAAGPAAARPSSPVWERTLGRGAAAAVAADEDDRRLFVAARSGGATFTLTALRFDGRTRWRVKLPGGPLPTRNPQVVLSPSGGTAYVAGTVVTGRSHRDLRVYAVDATDGDVAWRSSYDFDEDNERLVGLVVDPSGERVYLTGASRAENLDVVTIAYDARSGEQVWARRYDSGGEDEPAGIAVGSDGGRVFVAGSSYGAPTAFVAAYDAADGTREWLAEEAGPAGGSAFARDVASAGGRVFVTIGEAESESAPSATMVAYEASSGESEWRSQTPAFELAVEAAVTPDDRGVVVTGLMSRDGREDVVTRMYSAASGRLRWRRVYDFKSSRDYAGGLAVASGSGSVVVTGHGYRRDGRDAAVLLLSYRLRDGSPRWTRVLSRSSGGLGYEQHGDVAVAPNARAVFAAGLGFDDDDRPRTFVVRVRL